MPVTSNVAEVVGVRNCTFDRNEAARGGAFYIVNVAATIILQNIIAHDNAARTSDD